MISFTEDMQRRGLTVSTRVLFSGLIPATAYIAERLGIKAGEELACLKRLRLADGEPMCIEHSHFVHKYCRGILNRDFSTHSLRDVKIHKYGIRWSHARQTIQAINASRETARLLGVRPGGALLFFERASFSQETCPWSSCKRTIAATVMSCTTSYREAQVDRSQRLRTPRGLDSGGPGCPP